MEWWRWRRRSGFAEAAPLPLFFSLVPLSRGCRRRRRRRRQRRRPRLHPRLLLALFPRCLLLRRRSRRRLSLGRAASIGAPALICFIHFDIFFQSKVIIVSAKEEEKEKNPPLKTKKKTFLLLTCSILSSGCASAILWRNPGRRGTSTTRWDARWPCANLPPTPPPPPPPPPLLMPTPVAPPPSPSSPSPPLPPPPTPSPASKHAPQRSKPTAVAAAQSSQR